MKNKGFTLAETLITLVIIGIVAALTVPTVINKYTEQVTVDKLQNTYSVLSQALLASQQINGTPEKWNLNNDNDEEYRTYNREDSQIIAENILPYLKLSKDCGTQTNSSCTYSGNYKYLNGNNAGAYGNGNLYKIVLLNGSAISFGHWRNNEIIDFFIDINGAKKPNTVGKDLFVISYYKNKGLAPLGSQGHGYSCNKAGNGWGCTYFVLKNKNMNYP